VGAAEEATLLPSYVGADAGLALIDCVSTGSSSSRRQRGTLIDTGETDPSFEVVLTAAHGLPANSSELSEGCALVGGEETSFPIAAMWRPETRGRGSADDWAVLVAAGRIDGLVTRLKVAPLDDTQIQRMLSVDAPVRLPLRFPPGERPCGLTRSLLSDADVESGLFSHDCLAWSGHSGSPLVISVSDKVFVLGLHLGNRWISEDRKAIEIGRYIDASILTAIGEAADHGRNLSIETGQSQRGWLQRLFMH
jgi:hypothetical protein